MAVGMAVMYASWTRVLPAGGWQMIIMIVDGTFGPKAAEGKRSTTRMALVHNEQSACVPDSTRASHSVRCLAHAASRLLLQRPPPRP